MDQSTDPATQVAPPRSNTVQLQGIEDYEREALERIEQEAFVKRLYQPLQKRKPKPTIDEAVLAAERRALEEIEGTNWIGKIIEYRNAHPVSVEGLTFIEAVTGSSTIPRFSFRVIIFETSHHFGGDTVSFANKKTAKQYACKKAIDWLIENHHMPADGSIKFPKSAQSVVLPPSSQRRSSSTSSAIQSEPSTPNQGMSTIQLQVSYAAQVPLLCQRLGFNVPRYEIVPVVPQAPVYDAWADFGSDPRIDGRVGVVRNVHGKKNAKEEVARVVISFLKDIERQRLEGFAEEDRKRKRGLEEGGTRELEEGSGKVNKVLG